MDENHSRTVVKFYWINLHYRFKSSSTFFYSNTIRFSHVSLHLFYNYLIIIEEFSWKMCYVNKEYYFVLCKFFFPNACFICKFFVGKWLYTFSFINCAVFWGEQHYEARHRWRRSASICLLNKTFLKFITISSSCYIELCQNP